MTYTYLVRGSGGHEVEIRARTESQAKALYREMFPKHTVKSARIVR